MSVQTDIAIPSVRVLPEDVANKIAAGEVVERPASVVKELVENALDARATRITVRLVAAGRRVIEVVDNGHGMSEQDALLAIERHATSKVRTADDLERIETLGFRGEALASIGAVSRFELVTRRPRDQAATRIRVEGGVLRSVSQVAAPVGTRVAANRLYFNTPARAKFLKGITTELSHCIDVVQRHALAHESVGFQVLHNDKLLLDIPENASLRDRIALIWGLGFVRDLVALDAEVDGLRLRGYIGTPNLTRSQRSHQFFFFNGRPVTSPTLHYGFEEGYRELVTIGRHPVGIVLIAAPPRLADVNVHPAKREIRFRDERAARAAIRDAVRQRLARIEQESAPPPLPPRAVPLAPAPPSPPPAAADRAPSVPEPDNEPASFFERYQEPVQTELDAMEGAGFDAEPGREAAEPERVVPQAMFRSFADLGLETPVQIFDTYLLVPEADRLLIIDQHALHERLRYDMLLQDLHDAQYASQQLAVPLLVDVPPSHTRLLESNLAVFQRLGIDIEPFGGQTFQVTAICHLYDEAQVPDVVYRVLDKLSQGELFDKDDFMADLLRITVQACRGAVKAGDRLTVEERQGLLDGFRRLRPPYTCPHGRPIITELTLTQMEKSFRRRQ